MLSTIRHVVVSMRPKQWAKNTFLFAALFFSRRFLEASSLLVAFEAFVAFSAVASAVYLVNDIADRHRDRLHPQKKSRPLASGALSMTAAVVAAAVLAPGGLFLAWRVNVGFLHLVLVYLGMNLAYSLWLKKVVIVDVMMIAFGFVIRAYGGALAIRAPFSSWLLLCTIMLSLFIAFAKRRAEIFLLGKEATRHRTILLHYSPHFLDQMIAVTTASTVMSYALYTTSPEVVQRFGTDNLKFTLPFVLFGIFRYLYLIHQKHKAGDPTTAVLTDLPLLADVALWAAACGWILYS